MHYTVANVNVLLIYRCGGSAGIVVSRTSFPFHSNWQTQSEHLNLTPRTIQVVAPRVKHKNQFWATEFGIRDNGRPGIKAVAAEKGERGAGGIKF